MSGVSRFPAGVFQGVELDLTLPVSYRIVLYCTTKGYYAFISTSHMNPIYIPPSSLLPTHLLPAPLLPIRPTPRILRNFRPPSALGQLRRRATPHPRLAIEHHLGILSRPLEAEAILELLGRDEERIRTRRDRDIQRARDRPRILQLARLARVDEDSRGRGTGDVFGDLRRG